MVPGQGWYVSGVGSTVMVFTVDVNDTDVLKAVQQIATNLFFHLSFLNAHELSGLFSARFLDIVISVLPRNLLIVLLPSTIRTAVPYYHPNRPPP
eukprot:COSAG02_NODE_10346_length_1962_cov_100.808374_1_plen_95_part_00